LVHQACFERRQVPAADAFDVARLEDAGRVGQTVEQRDELGALPVDGAHGTDLPQCHRQPELLPRSTPRRVLGCLARPGERGHRRSPQQRMAITLPPEDLEQEPRLLVEEEEVHRPHGQPGFEGRGPLGGSHGLPRHRIDDVDDRPTSRWWFRREKS
jgi:hypothetical protein